jgi:hypothetical protein
VVTCLTALVQNGDTFTPEQVATRPERSDFPAFDGDVLVGYGRSAGAINNQHIGQHDLRRAHPLRTSPAGA